MPQLMAASLRAVRKPLVHCWTSRAKSGCYTEICTTAMNFGMRGWLAIDPKRLLGERGF